ncbi:MAG: tRNA pseudouridine(55) synthase TruB [Pseudomonadota bacterium]|nr:tRNA pseudouridine(55) synthase TruB [Pseudomonadota bacterium]
MNRRPRTVFRPLHGILLLDKPAGLSSNQALQQARHLFRASKGGHTGSLDPLATGLLPLCFGEATKIAGLLLGARKAYQATAVLGVTTDTDDADGLPLLERPVPALDAVTIEAALAPLRGPIMQRAPIYSALKQGGEPLYAKARRGETMQAPEREVLVHALDVLEQHDSQLQLHIECGSGTYVRSLVRDMGESLGCGAHVSCLRRLWVDPFRQPRMFTLEQLRELALQGESVLDACLLPIEAGLSAFPRIALAPEAARRLGLGQPQPLEAGMAHPGPGAVVVTDLQGAALGIASVDEDGTLRPQRLFTWACA